MYEHYVHCYIIMCDYVQNEDDEDQTVETRTNAAFNFPV